MPPGTLTYPAASSAALSSSPAQVRVPQMDVPHIATLKRRASSPLGNAPEDRNRKRFKEDMQDGNEDASANEAVIDGEALANDYEQELQCACCSALVYRPVVVAPCQHFFCGSCIVLWIRNRGTSCPSCRGHSTTVSPSRPLEVMVDILLRHAPSRARPENERIQADEIYKSNTSLRIPSPRQASPEPNISQRNTNYVHPCPHCLVGNNWGWRCPQPIVDPELDPDHAWHADDGPPPGHGYCGHCENVLALQAPSTSKCDLCQVSFCGIGIPGRCLAAPLLTQHMHGMANLEDILECGEVFDCFDGNSVEVDYMLDYLTAQRLTPRHIYREITTHIITQPGQFAPLIEQDIFRDVHSVPGGIDPDPSAPRSRICRVCATEVFLWGLRDWWIRERKKGFLEDSVTKRPDCPEGSTCARQKNHGHAKEFNHIIATPEAISAQVPQAGGRPEARLPLPHPLNFRDEVEFPPLPPFIPPSAPGSDDMPYFSQMSSEISGSSQDFRDEVDALL